MSLVPEEVNETIHDVITDLVEDISWVMEVPNSTAVAIVKSAVEDYEYTDEDE